MSRSVVTKDDLAKAERDAHCHTELEIEAKGNGAFVSMHEMLGVIDEERDELCDAVRAGDILDVFDELTDIATAALWSIASIRSWERQAKETRE